MTAPSTPQLESLNATAGLLQGRANRYAWFGLVLAIFALAAATLLNAWIEHQSISLDTIIEVQTGNPALWLLDIMPLLFMAWGQYIGTVMAYQAGALVLDETRALREQASVLEYQLSRSQRDGHSLGLPNRHAFISEANKAFPRRRMRGGHCGVLVIDTDQYHEVVQALGEDAAHEMAAQLASRLENILTRDDFLAHFGHDDFAIFMPRMNDDAESRRLASRIQLAMDTPLSIARQPTSIRVAIGIAHFPQHGDDAETLLRRAETAKFAAASDHRDYAVYDSGLESQRSEGPRLLAELHAALNHDGLQDEYELQKPMRDGLSPRLRLAPVWPHPRIGRLEEERFLQLPNRPSLLHSMTLWLLRDSLTRLNHWRQSRPGMGLIIRLPDRAFAELALSEMVFRLLASYGLPASALTLEVSQRGLLNGGDEAARQIQQLRAQDIRICLTEIGRHGGSPAARLQFAFDEIRTDPDLIQQAQHNHQAKLVLESFVHLARDLGLQVVVSGVDDDLMRRSCDTLEIDYVEGSAIAKRMMPGDIGGRRHA